MADDEGFGYYNRGRWDDDDEYEGSGSRKVIPQMAEVGYATTKIFGVVDLNGIPLLPKGKIKIGDDCLIPKEPFEDVVPDKKDYEGSPVRYRRTALILMYEDDVDDMRYDAEASAFEKLEISTANSPTYRRRPHLGLVFSTIARA
ncbi:hypothetical protein M413DRAFT_27179 [Hebeloma cylindrosporum]|uniref:Uncharacterized protein n=1 Tax=Hebeloma cylindrosporum TaxID=76867 RepID=A0A0C3CFL0_HEBCY|nr:hypothetical protein M413DRAFT_27179 [Hebeloma cylindrosporum h7]